MFVVVRLNVRYNQSNEGATKARCRGALLANLFRRQGRVLVGITVPRANVGGALMAVVRRESRGVDLCVKVAMGSACFQRLIGINRVGVKANNVTFREFRVVGGLAVRCVSRHAKIEELRDLCVRYVNLRNSINSRGRAIRNGCSAFAP